jgi:hypothetical protein
MHPESFRPPREGLYPVLLPTPTGILDPHLQSPEGWNPSKDSSPQDLDSDEVWYSCEPLEDLRLLFKKAPQDK